MIIRKKKKKTAIEKSLFYFWGGVLENNINKLFAKENSRSRTIRVPVEIRAGHPSFQWKVRGT